MFSYPKIRKYAKHKDKYSFEDRYAFVRKLITCFFRAFRVEINSNGFDKLKSYETYLFVSNHQAVTDALTLVYLSEKPMTFVTKKEAMKYPFVGKVCYIIDSIFIDRDNIRDAVKMVKTCKQYLNDGLNVAIYPEGTRTKDENYMAAEYKAGAFKSAYETKKNIAVVAIDGSYKIFSKKYKKNFKIDIEVMDVYDFNNYESKNTVELANEIQYKTNAWLDVIRQHKIKS